MATKRVWPRPDPDEIVDLLASLNKRYEADLELIDETRHLRERTWTINVPTELEAITGATGLEYHDPTISEDLQHLPTLYTSQFPSLSLRADHRAGEKTVDDLTTRVEYFTSAALFEECGCRAIGPPTHERLYQGVFSGAAWTQLVLRRDRWAAYDALSREGYDAEYDAGPRKGQRKYADAADYDRKSEEAKKKAGVPIDWLYKDPATIRPQYEGDELVAVIEVQTRDVVSCLKSYGLGMDEDGRICPSRTAVRDWTKRVEAGSTVEFIQYWDPVWRSYLVRYGASYGGKTLAGGASVYEIPGHTVRHRYNLGRPPYFGSLGATKDYEFARLATNHASEAKVDLVKSVSFDRTMLAYLAVRDALALLFETVPPDGLAQLEGDTGRPKQPEPYRLGTKITGQPGSTLTAVTFPEAGKTLAAEVAQKEDRLRRMGPTEVTGSLQGAGEAMATAFERDRARVNTHEATIVRHLSEVTQALWTLVAGLDEPVYVFPKVGKGKGGYVKVDPDDFATAVRPIWTLHVDSMAQDMIREQYGARRRKNGTLGQDQDIEMQGGNVDETLKSIAKEQWRAGPTYQEALKAEILARWSRGEWAQAQATAQRAAQLAAGPQPQPGPVAPQGLAVPAGAEGQTSAGASIAGPPPMAQQPGGVAPGVPPGTPANPAVQTGAATAGVHGGVPGG